MSNPAIFGHDLFGEVVKPKASGPVAERFTFPPFTILDAKQGDWQERKRAWSSVGIQGELGRDAASFGDCSQWQNREREVRGTNCTTGKNSCMIGTTELEEGGQCVTSIFDPNLCEIAYRWWCPIGGQILDPFAGGSVRGIVAGMLGRKYHGIDLRAEQIEANRKQAQEIKPDVTPEWVCGDSLQMVQHAPAADFLFSCPPYGDLEVYSDDPQDLSAMAFGAFMEAYRAIIAASVARLKPNRFACFVVGDFRDEKGIYRNFPGETVRAFLDAGCGLYNEAILATSVGSASMRVSRQFSAGRKLCKTHQNLYVFVKGDWRKASEECNRIPQTP